ncbi:P-loop containing nucleoside triphosphate hydrolase protein [Kickxella alabastrina]|nr:P-loop containing nucleoside triphosphate hydrolase protein [Kickxella alabastrina]KAI7833680.1 P-loop containing nucleoside triphosphate hydrolase protein [Kickxella alabastrina]
MAFLDDDFVMTINDDDEVPDLETLNDESDIEPQTKKRKSDNKSKRTKTGEPNTTDDIAPIAKGFVIDLEADGLDSVSQTLDFTLARASLKRRNNPGLYSSLDDKIAATRRAAKIAKKFAASAQPEVEEKEAEKSEEEDEEDDDKMSVSDEDAQEDVSGSDADSEEIGSEIESDEAEEESGDEEASGDEEETDSDKEQGAQAVAATADEELVDDSEISNSSSESESESEVETGSEGENSDSESEVDEMEEARKRAYFAPQDETTASDIPDSFTLMNLSRPIMKGITKLGFAQPTPIQARTIPVALLGKDVCGGAQTGSGKTAAFLVPKVPATRVLILCPTRELAIQCHNVGSQLAGFTDITTCLCVGGLSLKGQEMELRQRPDIVIATPGRLIDHLRNSQSFHLDQIEILIMDEADRMLEDGFEDELTEIIKACPKKRQTMLFSATMTDNVDKLIRVSLNKPVRVQIDPPKSAAKNLVQEFVRVRSNRDEDRTALLAALCKRHFKKKCIVFFRSKAAAHQMKIIFGLMGLRAAELHGNLSQEGRLQALEQFRDGHVDYLMATDLAARGLDVKGVETVINYTMPNQFPQYLHRVGRTARAGRTGRAITLIGETDRKMLKLAVKHSSKDHIKQRVVPNETLNKYRAKVDDLAPQVKSIVDEEREEKMFKDADMQMTKASNLLNHKTEIQSRPRRTWFQTEKDRNEAKKASKNEYLNKNKKRTKE